MVKLDGDCKISVRDGKERKDRTVYVTDTTVRALQEYLVVRGEGSGDHVFLFLNAPLNASFILSRLKSAGKRVGVRVYPHRLRYTCASQLLNAGCRITSIQRFMGHKKLNTTMIYARAYDKNVAEDYFKAMERVEQRLNIVPVKEEPKSEYSVVNVQERSQVIVWVERLAALPELCQQERLEIAEGLKQVLCLNYASQLSPPMVFAG